MGAEHAFGTGGTLFGHSARLGLSRSWLKRRSAYSLPPGAPGPAPACRNSHQVPNTPPCQLVGAARRALAPALAKRAPEAGCQVWGWGRAFRRAGGLLGRPTISYGPNDQVDRVAAPATAGNNRWLQSPKPVEVTWACVGVSPLKEQQTRRVLAPLDSPPSPLDSPPPRAEKRRTNT